MIHKMFTIQDAAADAYLTPFFLHREAMAKRQFADCINDSRHQFGKHPAHYTLLLLGEFDDSTGEIKPYHITKALGNGIQYLVNESDPDQLNLLKDVEQS